MLKKFNDLYNKLILESKEYFDEPAKDEWHRTVLTDAEFLKNYLVPIKLNKDGLVKDEFMCLDFVIARENTFRAIGNYKSIITFLDLFKVDDKFLPQGVKFEVFSPTISIVDNVHFNNFGEGYDYGCVPADSLNAYNSIHNASNDSRWYDFFETIKSKETNTESAYKVRVKKIEPKKLKKLVEELVSAKTEEFGFNKDFLCIQLEFKVNCNGLANNLFDEMTYFKPEFKED
jgi:hypothetical protein